MASVESGFSSARTQLRQSAVPRCKTCENLMTICDGTGAPGSNVNYTGFHCDSGINCERGSLLRGARWGCHGWNHKKSVLVNCTSDICFRCRPAPALPATGPLGGTATHTDVGSAGSGDGNSKLAAVPADCAAAIQTLTEGLAQTGSLKRKIAELQERVTELTQELQQTESLKLEIDELRAQVTEVRESASQQYNALKKEKEDLQAKYDQQIGIGIRDLSPDELRALYAQSLSTASMVAKRLKEDEARRLAGLKHNEYLCPISQDWMSDPVTASDGHTYERKEITKWFLTCEQKQTNLTSPKTNAPLESKTLTPNHTLRQAMQTTIDNTIEGLVLEEMNKNRIGDKRRRTS